MGFFDRLKASLTKTREKLADKIDEILHGSTKIDDELLDELEETLIMSDVGTKTTDKLMTALRKGVRRAEINSTDDVKKFLANQIREILISEQVTEIDVKPPKVILMIGVQVKLQRLANLRRIIKSVIKKLWLRRQIHLERARLNSLRYGLIEPVRRL